MTDDERALNGLSEPEEKLAGQLEELGPLMREQERAEAEMDPQFARNLRAHLVHGEELAPHPTFARNLRARLLRRRSARPVRKPSRRRTLAWMGLGGGAAAAVVAALLVVLLHRPQTPAPAFKAPFPSRSDLVFSYPSSPIVIHHLTPTVSLVHPAPGLPYAGRLQLKAGALPTEPTRLTAYRLTAPSNVVTLGRRLFGIRSPVRHLVAATADWAVAADGGIPSHRPLHSLAISLRTGELIYHDRRNTLLPHASHPLDRIHAVGAARNWLSRLGWPGRRMPVRLFGNVGSLRYVRSVAFAWIGVGETAVQSATLWVTPNGSVIEAWVWPPVAQQTLIPTRPVSAAWTEVRKGTLPLAVEGVSPYRRANGTGALQRTIVAWVLSAGARGNLYLVPTYRFEGSVHIPGASIHTWYGLAPSAQR